jgi:hypothetical protein
MKNKNDKDKILEFVRVSTAVSNVSSRRNRSIGLSKLKTASKINPEVDLLNDDTRSKDSRQKEIGVSTTDLIFLNNRAYHTNSPFI